MMMRTAMTMMIVITMVMMMIKREKKFPTKKNARNIYL